MRLTALVPLLLLGAVAPTLRAQDDPLLVEFPESSEPRTLGQREQIRFEQFRRMNLPQFRGNRPRQCQEVVGRFCYWYDESTPAAPPEHPRIVEARDRLIRVLDSLALAEPTDEWISGQRVRYLNEAGRDEDALAAAKQCQSWNWWCDALQGFALHALGRYAEAEAAYDQVIPRMPPRQRCTWLDLTPYLDDDTRREYIRSTCGDERREAFEARVWALARVRYGLDGNDSRTEHFARLTYVEFLRQAPSVFMFGFDESEREMLIRFGWPVSWSRDRDLPASAFGGSGGARVNVVSQEATPAYRFIPPYGVVANPAVSDSTQWAVQLPPVVARYAPPYAKKLLMLEHQQALFRRGDTALVVLAYDVGGIAETAGARLEAALALAPSADPRGTVTKLAEAPRRGTMAARAPWGPLLMSAEVAVEEHATLVRARYGIRPPLAIGTRVVISDLLFYTPYGEFPGTVEEVLPHALATQRVRSSEPLGVYWEAYNTNPAGERMTISLTVVPETEESGRLRGLSRALRLARESAPVSLTVEDMSARGGSVSPRAVQLDISTLRKGEYLVQLEISVAGQYTIRADRRLVVTGP